MHATIFAINVLSTLAAVRRRELRAFPPSPPPHHRYACAESLFLCTDRSPPLARRGMSLKHQHTLSSHALYAAQCHVAT
ncbi:hypothetical protein IWX49DRAFT_560860 [Phyllosticta citricarpa]